MVKVSVLIPIYNVQEYLEQCLDSIINQTLADIEIICVDDGSTDRSGEILDQYADMDARIRVIHKNNSGYGHSMNVALAHATGEYVAVIESDDFAEPDMLEKLYVTAVEQRADVVKANHYDYRNGKDVFFDRLREYPLNKLINVSDFPQLLNLADTIWSCLYNREFLINNQIRFHETPGASFQDISFSLQAWLKAQRVYFVQDAVLHYRTDNPDSSMHNPDKIFCVFGEYEWLEVLFEEKWIKDTETEKYFVATKYRDYLEHYYRVAMQYQYALLLRIKESLEKDTDRGRVDETAFTSALWKKICAISHDVKAFYLETAGSIPDPRIKFFDLKNEETYVAAFFQKLKEYPHVVIYGAGKIGQKLAAAILSNGGKVDCFAVTKADQDCMGHNGIPVKELREAADMADSCAVIIAVSEKSQYELCRNLSKYNFKNIYRVDPVVKKFI